MREINCEQSFVSTVEYFSVCVTIEKLGESERMQVPNSHRLIDTGTNLHSLCL